MTPMAQGGVRLLAWTLMTVLTGWTWVGVEPTGAAVRVRVDGAGEVPRHSRVEFVVEVDRVYRNPYDSAEVEVDLEVTAPSGVKTLVPTFFYQPYQWRRIMRGDRGSEWMYPAGEPGWRARFAPREAGQHRARAVVRDREGLRRSEERSFGCPAQASKGYVRVSRTDPRFLEFEDGTVFFPIGQNAAFVGAGQYLDGERAADVFRKMSAHGANFARVWVCAEDWALGIEARKSAWGRSWDWHPPVTVLPGRDGYHSDEWCLWLGAGEEKLQVSTTHPLALRPETRYRLSGLVLAEGDGAMIVRWGGTDLGEPIRSGRRSEWTKWERLVTTPADQWWLGELSVRLTGRGPVWFRQLSLQEEAGGPELLWEAELGRPVRGVYNQLDSYMVDRLVEAAERTGIYLQLCLLTRDHYMPALTDRNSPAYGRVVDDAKKLMRYVVGRWGYSRQVAAWEYFNEMNPGLPTADFYREVGVYLQRVDPYGHVRTTSAWGPAPRDWEHPQLDVANMHWYLRPAWGEIWRDETASVLDRAKFLRERAGTKPALLAEFGLATDSWGRSPYMQQDRENVHFHNSQWASAFAGLSGAALFWWWESLDQGDAYGQYRPLAEFVRDIPFAAGHLQAKSGLSEKQKCRVLSWQGADRAYGWLSNPEATWWKLVVEKQPPAEVREDWLGLEAMEDGTYEVAWWDTWTGKLLKQEQARTDGGKLRVGIPTFARDVAIKVIRRAAVPPSRHGEGNAPDG